MTKIRPTGFDVTLIYTCSKCESEHFVSREETIFPAGILCYCGKKLKLESINEINVDCGFGKEKVATKEQPKQSSQDFDEALESLIGLGYTRQEAENRVQKASELYDTPEECLKHALSY
jgi:hypothetical protein